MNVTANNMNPEETNNKNPTDELLADEIQASRDRAKEEREASTRYEE